MTVLALSCPRARIRALPAGRPLLPEVDGRDWPAIPAWAAGIAQALGD